MLIALSATEGVFKTAVGGTILLLLIGIGVVVVATAFLLTGTINRNWPVWARVVLAAECILVMLVGYLLIIFAFWAVVPPRPWMIPKVVTGWKAFLAWLYLPAVPLALGTWTLALRRAWKDANKLGTRKT